MKSKNSATEIKNNLDLLYVKDMSKESLKDFYWKGNGLTLGDLDRNIVEDFLFQLEPSYSPLCQDFYLLEENHYFCDILCTGKYFSVNISAQESCPLSSNDI